MKLYIKNMVCPVEKFFVKMELERLGLDYRSVELGEIEMTQSATDTQLKQLEVALQPYKLELAVSI